MSQKNELDYFQNHIRSQSFPWTLYHAPLEKSLSQFLNSKQNDSVQDILCIGCGLWFEKEFISARSRVVCIDIDSRAIEILNQKKDSRLVSALVTKGEPFKELIDQKFDLIYAKEVIEHSRDPELFLNSIRKLLKPSGKVWISTPNYGEPWLPFLETTFLEWVARRSGYSRKEIHPSKFSAKNIYFLAEKCGFKVDSCNVVSARLAIVIQLSI